MRTLRVALLAGWLVVQAADAPTVFDVEPGRTIHAGEWP